MRSWVDVVALIGAVVTLYLMVVGTSALWTRKMQLIGGGRTLYGPLAQFCGLLLLASLPLSLLTCGQAAYLLGAGIDPEPARAKVLEFLTVEADAHSEEKNAPRRHEARSAAKRLALAWAFDLGVFGVVLAALVIAQIELGGVRPTPLRR